MGWNGSGTVTLLYDFTADRDAGAPDHFIDADKFDALNADFAAAIEACLNRNGENAMAANASWGGFKITSLGAATAATDAIRARQVAENAVQYGGTTGGSANAYTVTNTFIDTVATGTRLLCIANHTNNGATTINVNNGGAVAVVERDGATALVGGEIVSGDFFEVAYDGTSWVLLSSGNTVFGAALVPDANDGAALGTASLSFSDLFLADGGVINFNNGNATITHSTGALAINVPTTVASIIPSSSSAPSDGLYLPAANTLGWSVNSTGEMQLTAGALSPITTDGLSLGTSSLMWSDAFFASGGVINFNNGDVTVTHSTDVLAFAGASTGYSFSGGAIYPSADDGLPLGGSSNGFSDLYLANGGIIYLNNVQAFPFGASASTSLSSTSVNITGIPAGVRRLTVVMTAGSTNGSSGILLQIGPSGGVATSGYNGVQYYVQNASSTVTGTNTAGVEVIDALGFSASAVVTCTVTFHLTDPATNTWTWQTNATYTAVNPVPGGGSGQVALSGALEQILLKTGNGTDTFDAGTIRVFYEF